MNDGSSTRCGRICFSATRRWSPCDSRAEVNAGHAAHGELLDQHVLAEGLDGAFPRPRTLTNPPSKRARVERGEIAEVADTLVARVERGDAVARVPEAAVAHETGCTARGTASSPRRAGPVEADAERVGRGTGCRCSLSCSSRRGTGLPRVVNCRHCAPKADAGALVHGHARGAGARAAAAAERASAAAGASAERAAAEAAHAAEAAGAGATRVRATGAEATEASVCRRSRSRRSSRRRG